MSDGELAGWLGAASLGRVWELIATRLERSALVPRGGVVVRALDREERHGLSDLLGRPVVSDAARVDLVTLDERLRSRAGLDVVTAAERVLGRELVDLPALRERQAAERATPFAAARTWLDEHGVPTADPRLRWIDDWLDALRRDGTLARLAEPTPTIVAALEVLAARRALVAAKENAAASTVARTELAAAATGSAHGLDDSERLSGIVLRALAAREQVRLPRSAEDRRRLWESVGVVTDRVSTTCLVFGLQAAGESAVARRLGVDLAAGSPSHLTWWDLDAGLEFSCAQRVLVCENPRTLEALAQQGIAAVGAVCTMGRPALVVLEVLTRLRSAGCELRYHGDFDWAGVAMTNALVTSHGVRPWAMSADDYLAGHGTSALTGAPVAPGWDAELGSAMRHRGVAVHEEAVLTRLLTAVTDWATGS